ncbi:hypothetical protein FB567DRAFT_489518 [Paraphoma chrysanthemicola]|uniref:Uncharacterized protein n=1 Tax=Paraphoma chrysanthemicola TaxID=798071 RepID=A0A8K0REI1_9PLEO|nr:hypothetical protein FB567DRAFT_489518 [Paraphoma chrysanthemicola]
MTAQLRELEHQRSEVDNKYNTLLAESDRYSTQIGKLRYQNEANRDQKAAMGRSLAQQEVEIKKQQLEIDNLNRIINDLKSKISRQQQELSEIDRLRSAVKDISGLEETVKRLTLERDHALRAQVNSGDHALRAQNLGDTLAKREKLITDLRQKTLEEQMRATELEDEVERLREQVVSTLIDDLKEKLLEKTSQCDRYRTQLKATEQQLKLSQSRLLAAMDGGESLRGGAHLVIPHKSAKLPKAVVSCSECYAQNTPCDNGAVCRPCIDSNSKCSRWRCSSKHRLGECNRVPCTFPHDSQGWMIRTEPRPEW